MSMSKRGLSLLLACWIAFLPAWSSADQSRRILSEEALEGLLRDRADARERDLQEIGRLLHHELVQNELGNLVDLERVEAVLPTLDDETLEMLAEESRSVNDSIRGDGAGRTALLVVLLILVSLAIIYVSLARDAERRGS